MPSPFDILQIDPEADDETIAEAYKRRVFETHPDHGGSAREFHLVRMAFEQLTNGSDSQAEIDTVDEGIDARIEYLNYDLIVDHGLSLDDEGVFDRIPDTADPADHGRFRVHSDESLLEAAENRGFTWPYSCRGGACANCAVKVTKGELSMPVNHILPESMLDRGIRLSCVGKPMTDELSVIFNVKHLPPLDELRLPPGPFNEARQF